MQLQACRPSRPGRRRPFTQSGDVFGHEVSGHSVGAPFKFTGSKVAFNGPVDRFVMTMGNMVLVTTQNGDAFGHDVSASNDVSQPFQLNPAPLSLHLREHGTKTDVIEVVGEGFTRSSTVRVAHQFKTVGSDGVGHLTQGDSVTASDPNGHFDQLSFSLPGKNSDIQARAVDVGTGRSIDSNILRPQVRVHESRYRRRRDAFPPLSVLAAGTGAQRYGVLGRALSCFRCSSCFCFFTCCCLCFTLSFLPPLSPISAPFRPSRIVTVPEYAPVPGLLAANRSCRGRSIPPA